MFFSTSLVVAGLSSGQKIGLGAFGIAFIVFALISSFVLPSRRPNFPGKHMGWYIAVVVLFFVAMLAAVLTLGKEKKEASAETTPATTTTSGGGGGGGGGANVQGDPAAGKAVFTSAGCSGCHTLKAANATGNVGPNLDQLKPAEATVVHQVINGGGAMPAFKGTLSTKQIQDVAAFVFVSTSGAGGGGGGGGGATTTTTAGGGATAPTGDATAGKTIFTSAGCSGCHTLKDAHATGKVGPNLDQLMPPEATVEHQVINGGGAMPAFKGTLSAKQIRDVATYVFTATHK